MGDVFYVTGIIVTARDEAHKKAIELHENGNETPIDFKGLGIFHCGPIMKKTEKGWATVAAGPTTSDRMEIFQDRFIEYYRPSVIIGKGGMGARTLAALKEHGAVYLNAIGGAAQYYARCITEVEGVDFLDFGIPEAMWHIRVKEFPAVVTMDAKGNSLHAEVEKASGAELAKFAGATTT